MNTNLAGARVVLTGCTANIGRAAALAFADEGARLVLVDRDTAAQATADAISAEGGEATFVAADVSDEDSVAAMLREADDRLGGLDVIVNNAGLQRAGSVTEMTLADWDALMSVNPRSCFLTAKHGVPIFRRGGGGVFVNMASLAAVKGGPGLTGYSASKGAIVAFTRALAAEVAPDGIRANALCPGWVDTPFNDPAQDFLGGREALESAVRAGVPLGRQASPEEMAQSLLFLASAASSYMTGQTLVVDGGVS
jgi:NAD(P)-dependent dehydrogenase (short-subunit alcohol dehydrogenase family)